MEKKDRFLSEWTKSFPKEEPPDMNFFNSVNFLNIRRKISKCENRIKNLKLEVQKEEFILNWLITVDIEISVLGNVGMGSSMDEDEGPKSNDASKCSDDGSTETNSEGFPVGKMEDSVEDEGKEIITNLTDKGEGPSISHKSRSLSNISETKENIPASEGISGAHVEENVFGEIDEETDHEYVNVFDLIEASKDKQTTNSDSDIEQGKDKDRRRGGGSWSVYIECEDKGENEKETIESSNEDMKIDSDVDEKLELSHQNDQKKLVVNEKKDSPIYEEVRFLNEDVKKSDNVTVNLLYENTDIKFNPENSEEPEEESIYQNILEMNLFGKHALIPSGIRIEGNDSASDYDSDGGSRDLQMREAQPLPGDEMDFMRKWRSDEDCSQSSRDLDERSGDSDDSVNTGTNSKISSEAKMKENVQMNKEREALKKTANDNDSLKSQDEESREFLEEMEAEGERQKMRKYLVKNLLESEKCYFDCLDMVRKYMKALEKSTETSQPILTKLEFTKIFSGIDGLYYLHKDLLQKLKERILSWDENQVIGDLLKILMDGFSLYKDYINNYKSSQETLLKCRNANSIFDDILKKDIRISSLKEPIKLDALLYKPVDRMTQYSLILNDLLKNTSEDHADNELLSEATANLFDLFEQVNVDRRDKKAPQRQLLKEGKVVELVDSERKARTLILMNDVIICAKFKSPKEAYVCKWYSSLVDLQLKPFTESEAAQSVPVTTKPECDKLRAMIANIRSEMRRETLILTPSASTDGGSPFARPKVRKRDSSIQPLNSRASTRGMEKLRKKLHEQERLLQLISPNVPLTLYHKNGKTYTLLLSSEDDKLLWKEAINQRIKRLTSRKQDSTHLSSVEIQQALDISFKVHKLGMRFGAIIPSPLLVSEREDLKLNDEEGLTGFLYVHIRNGKSFSKAAEFYCVLEVDSYGYFFRKAKTKSAKGSEPQWDEDFEFDVEAASSLRLTCYTCRSRLLGDEFSGKATVNLTKENLTDNQSHTFSVILDKQGAITLTISYSSSLQDIERTRTDTNCTNVFKERIASVARREKFDIPLVVISCIKEIEKRGLKELGIYRLSGIASEVKSLKSAFDENPQSAVFALSEADINAVAGLVKLFFRELPEPLFTNSRYPRFVSGLQIQDAEEKELYMTDLLQQLPKPNKLTALYLLEHLRRVSQFEKVNKMGINNLSTVFGPTVLRPSVADNQATVDKLRSGTTFDIGALDVMSQVSIFRYFLGLNSSKVRLPPDDLELWQRLDHQKAAAIQERLMDSAVEYLI